MIFVFGSNLAGRHGKGAAKYARENYQAHEGVGEGMTGLSYAIPTKGKRLEVLPLSDIDKSICKFLNYAKTHGGTYMLTPIGTGLAGYSKRQIWAILSREGVPSNVFLTSTWITE